MLYDPKWEKKVTTKKKTWRWFGWLRQSPTPANVFEKHDFICWLSEQNPTTTYQYIDPLNCAVAQYLQARGVGKFKSMLDGRHLNSLWGGLSLIAQQSSSFGELAVRARRLAERG